ncbi:ABC transporter permease [Sphaerimonospora mesophila]|uniref:ABC transporter permease n=1 Tax=Sphaerimonospora mesophila TaxID=37483 RepID=UPI0007C6BC8D
MSIRRTSGGRFDRLLSVYAVLVYLFLFVPIAVVVVFSFNAGRHVTQLEGLSLTWYEQAWTDPFILDALRNSLQISVASAVISTLLGTAAAIGVTGLRRSVQRTIELMTYVAVVIPAIVLGLSLLLAFVTFADWLNPWLAYLWPGDTPPELGLGKLSVIAGESVFGTALVMIVLKARIAQMDSSLRNASADLYATPLRTLFQVTLPQLASAIVGGFLLAFTFAFDDFIIAFFTRGQSQTLPILLFSSIRRGVSPAINAIASVLVLVTLVALLLALFVLTRRGRRGVRAQAPGEPAKEAAAADGPSPVSPTSSTSTAASAGPARAADPSRTAGTRPERVRK